jgi:hypothetical protein
VVAAPFGSGAARAIRVPSLLPLVLIGVAACSRAAGGPVPSEPSMALTSTGDTAEMMFIASPHEAVWGSPVELSWSAPAGDHCVASGGWQGDKPATGRYTSQPLQADTSFVLSCARGDRAQASVHRVTVDVLAVAPDLDFESQHDLVPVRSGTTLHWQASGAEVCSASGGWQGDLPTSGSYDTGPLTASTSYSLHCSSEAGTALTTVLVQTFEPGRSPNS